MFLPLSPARRPIPPTIYRPGRSTFTRTPEIALATGPLVPIEGKEILVLADHENWFYSARAFGARVSFRRLGERLRLSARACALRAFFSRTQGDERRMRYLAERGWQPHANDIEEVATCRGTERRANCDNFLLFMAGVLASRSKAEVVVIGSGDGRLSGELARALNCLPTKRTVLTLSLAGSTARSLDAKGNPDIAANLEIGRDCLRGL